MLGFGSFESILLGQHGSYIATDTVEHIGDWGIITPLTDTVITLVSGTRQVGLQADGTTAKTANVVTGNTGALTALTIKAGIPIVGRFSSFTLASGSVIAYRLTPV